MKKHRIIVVVFLFVSAIAFLFTGCGDDKEKRKPAVRKKISTRATVGKKIEKKQGQSGSPATVSKKITLPVRKKEEEKKVSEPNPIPHPGPAGEKTVAVEENRPTEIPSKPGKKGPAVTGKIIARKDDQKKVPQEIPAPTGKKETGLSAPILPQATPVDTGKAPGKKVLMPEPGKEISPIQAEKKAKIELTIPKEKTPDISPKKRVPPGTVPMDLKPLIAEKTKPAPKPEGTVSEISPVSAPKRPASEKRESELEVANKLIAIIQGLDEKRKKFWLTSEYNPEGKLDPFIPLVEEKKQVPDTVVTSKKTKGGEKEEEIKKRPLTPLEMVDLSQLKLVAIVRSTKGNKALVQEASGKGYIVTKGTYIGRNQGKVDEILQDRIIVVEDEYDYKGNLTQKKRELKIQRPAGEEWL